MDIYCTRCGEPWELDFLHDVAEENRQSNADQGVTSLTSVGSMMGMRLPETYKGVLADFKRRGCVALGGSQCERQPSLRTEAMSAMFDVLGDDADGAASMMEDLEYMGLLDEDGEL